MSEIRNNLKSIYNIFVSLGNSAQTIILGIAGVIAIVMVIVAGFKFLTGGQTGASEAWSRIKNITIGIAMIALAGTIVTFTINSFFKVSPDASHTSTGASANYSISDFEGGLSDSTESSDDSNVNEDGVIED